MGFKFVNYSTTVGGKMRYGPRPRVHLGPKN